MNRLFSTLALVLSLPLAAQAQGQLVVGSFDAVRSPGTCIAANGALIQHSIAALQENFPCVQFRSAPALTPAFLAQLDVLVLMSSTNTSAAITMPLSAPEQAALFQFVAGGGSAFLLVDNDSFAQSAQRVHDSMLGPFGMTFFANNPESAPCQRSEPCGPPHHGRALRQGDGLSNGGSG